MATGWKAVRLKELQGAGRVLVTLGAQDAVSLEEQAACTARHMAGDWGDVDEEDAAQNDKNLDGRGQLMSVYNLGDKTLWIITDAAWNCTTLLLPEEY